MGLNTNSSGRSTIALLLVYFPRLFANLTGEVSEISESTITVNIAGELLKFTISANTQAQRLVVSQGVTKPWSIAVKDIKKGDRVSIYGILIKEGELTVQGITVITP